MKVAHIKFRESKYNYSTRINGSEKSIKEYYIGKEFNLGTVEDDIQICIDCVVEDSNQDIINQLRNLKSFSYNDIEFIIKTLELFNPIDSQFKDKFLSKINNRLIHNYIDESINIDAYNIEKIIVEVCEGGVYCNDPRVKIINHADIK